MTGKRLQANGSPYEIFINGKTFPSRRRGGRYCAENEGLEASKANEIND